MTTATRSRLYTTERITDLTPDELAELAEAHRYRERCLQKYAGERKLLPVGTRVRARLLTARAGHVGTIVHVFPTRNYAYPYDVQWDDARPAGCYAGWELEVIE